MNVDTIQPKTELFLSWGGLNGWLVQMIPLEMVLIRRDKPNPHPLGLQQVPRGPDGATLKSRIHLK